MGYRGNEVADKIAKYAANNPRVGCEPFFWVGAKELKNMSKNIMISKQNVRRRGMDTCKNT